MVKDEKNKPGKTASETKTFELLSLFFSPFPVFANPSYKMNKSGGELCDILVILPYATLVVQVKGAEETKRTPESWLMDKVYNKAAKQAKEAALRLHQGAAVFCGQQFVRQTNAPIADIYPIAVFDEISPKNYYNSPAHGELTINVFDYEGLRDAMNVIRIPREFVNYLEKRPSLFRKEKYGTMYPVLPLKDEVLITGSAKQEVNHALRFLLAQHKESGSKELLAIQRFFALRDAIKRHGKDEKALLEFLACFDLKTVLLLMKMIEGVKSEKGIMATDCIKDNTGRLLILMHVPTDKIKRAEALAGEALAIKAGENGCRQCFVLGFLENSKYLMVLSADFTDPQAAALYRSLYEDYLDFLNKSNIEK